MGGSQAEEAKEPGEPTIKHIKLEGDDFATKCTIYQHNEEEEEETGQGLEDPKEDG